MKNRKDEKACLRYITLAKNRLSFLSFNEFGSAWEVEANSFFEELVLYFEIEIIPKFKMGMSDRDIGMLHQSIQNIFNAIYTDDYSEAKDEIKKVNDVYKKKKKSFFERHKIDRNRIIEVFSAIILIVFAFFSYWGFTMFKGIQFSIETSAVLAFGIPAALYYSMKFFREVRKK